MIGYEFELLVREGDRPLTKRSFEKFHGILSDRGWIPKFDAGTGGLVGSEKDGFFLTTDDGVCVMEINTPPRNSIHECHEQITVLIHELQEIYRSLGCSIIGVSTFPGLFDTTNRSCADHCIDEQCCNKSYIKYFNAQRFPSGHHALYVFAAHQVWLDVPKKELLSQWNVFNRVSPILIALFANGPVFNNENLGVLEGRDVLWSRMLDSSVVGNDARYYGMPAKPFSSLLEYFDDALSTRFYFDLRDGKGYKLIDPKLTFLDFFQARQLDAQYFDGTRFTVQPQLSDFLGLQQKTFPHVRIKYTFSDGVTLQDIMGAYLQRDEKAFLSLFSKVFLECRAIGAQPQSDLSAGPAFLLGLQNNLKEVNAILNRFPDEFWLSLYHEVQNSGLEAEQNGVCVHSIAQELFDAARVGLQSRQLNEDSFLKPISDRLSNHKNPANEVLEVWKVDGCNGIFALRDFRSDKNSE